MKSRLSLRSRAWTLVACAMLGMTLLTGCAKFDLARRIPWGEGKDGEIGEPLKLVALWTDTVLQQDGKPNATRGFGGRLMFHGRDGDKTIKVEGTLVVYAFFEHGRDSSNVKPDRKFVFTPEQVAKHYSKSEIGHSYSFWLPLDDANGAPMEVSLIARFTPQNGSVVVSEQTRHILPGSGVVSGPTDGPQVGTMPGGPYAGAVGAAASPSGVQPVAYNAPLTNQPSAALSEAPAAPAASASPRPRMSTTTIPAPSSMLQYGPVPSVAAPATTAPAATVPAATATPAATTPAAAPAVVTTIYGHSIQPPRQRPTAGSIEKPTRHPGR